MKDEEMTEERLANESWFSEDNGYRIMTSEATYIYAFKKGLKAGRPQWRKVFIEGEPEGFTLPRDILGLWEQTVCEIRGEIKAQDTPALVYAKELCDKLEHSMCALAGGNYQLQYSIEGSIGD